MELEHAVRGASWHRPCRRRGAEARHAAARQGVTRRSWPWGRGQEFNKAVLGTFEIAVKTSSPDSVNPRACVGNAREGETLD